MLKTVIPFGPQHPVLPEPIHLKLTVEDERIVEAIPSLGFVHRGLERLADIRDFNQMIQVVERVCGICVDACPSNSLSQKRAYRPPSMMPELISLKGHPRKATSTKTQREGNGIPGPGFYKL
jgi:ferredoxin